MELVHLIDKLKGRQNYEDWCIAMKALLEHEDLWSCVEGAVSEDGSIQFCEDDRKNTRAKSLIILCLNPICYAHVTEAKKAREVWSNLNIRYSDPRLNSKIGLLRMVFGAKLEDFKSKEEYVSAIIRAANKLKNNFKMDVTDDWLSLVLLKGLPDQYTSLITELDNSNVKVTSDLVINKILYDVRYHQDNYYPQEKWAGGIRRGRRQ